MIEENKQEITDKTIMEFYNLTEKENLNTCLTEYTIFQLTEPFICSRLKNIGIDI